MSRLPSVIAFDAKRATSNLTGLGNYSRLVIDSVAAALPQTRLLLYSPHPESTAAGRLCAVTARPNVEVAGPRSLPWTIKPGPSLWRVWRGLTGELRRSGAGLYHGLSGELPFDVGRAGIPTVVTIHDLIFRRFTEGYSAVDRVIYDRKFRAAAAAATRVIAISEATKRDVMHFYGVPEEKVDVVYQGCDAQFSRPVDPSLLPLLRREYNLPELYVISVGTIEPRKNQLLTLQALRGLPSDVHLVIVGRPGPYKRQLDSYARAHGLTPRLHYIHNAPFAHLPALYRMASAAAYTSRAEGFGIPVIEALSCGTPVLATTGTCLEEAGGKGALYVSPDDPEGASAALLTLMERDSERAALLAAAKEHIKRFSPETFTAALLAVYRKAVQEHRLSHRH